MALGKIKFVKKRTSYQGAEGLETTVWSRKVHSVSLACLYSYDGATADLLKAAVSSK